MFHGLGPGYFWTAISHSTTVQKEKCNLVIFCMSNCSLQMERMKYAHDDMHVCSNSLCDMLSMTFPFEIANICGIPKDEYRKL